MLRTLKHERKGEWPADAARGTVTLAYDNRHRRRLRLESDGGEPFLLDLAETSVLEDGDGLALSDGTWLAVRAKPEPLIEVTAADPAALARLAWHLGNRHLPVEIAGARLLLREDHVIAALLEALGARLRRVEAPFSPERGAFQSATHHHHDD